MQNHKSTDAGFLLVVVDSEVQVGRRAEYQLLKLPNYELEVESLPKRI